FVSHFQNNIMVLIYIIAALIVIMLIVAALLPSKYHVQQSTIIKSPVDLVMKHVGDLNYYREWNPWQKMEPEAASAITGDPMSTGHTYSWEGKRIGVGNLVLKQIDPKHIYFDLNFLRPWKSNASDNWLFEEWGEGETKITWQNFGDL